MTKNAFELGDHQVVWHNGVGYQVSYVDEYGIEARSLFTPGRGFNNNAVSEFQKTEDVYGGKEGAIFAIKSILTRHNRAVYGLQEELERLEALPDDEKG